MDIKFVYGTRSIFSLDRRLDILADDVTPEQFEKFCELVRKTLGFHPEYFLSQRTRQEIGGFTVKHGNLVKKVKFPLAHIEFYDSDRMLLRRPKVVLATKSGLEDLKDYTFVDADLRMGWQVYDETKPNFLAFTAKPSDGRRVLEAIAKDVPRSVIRSDSHESVYRALGMDKYYDPYPSRFS